MSPNPSANRPDHGLSLVTFSESSTDYLNRNQALKIAISKGFHKCAFSFIERVGISGGSLSEKMNVNCFLFYQVTETESFIVN